VACVHIAASLTQVTDARFNPRAGFGGYHFTSGNKLVARMSPAVRPGKRDGRVGWLFLFNGRSELVARMRLVVCLGKRGRIASSLLLMSGNKLVAKIDLVVRSGKHGGRARGLFRFTGSLGRGRACSFRLSLAIAPFHTYTILAQRLQTGRALRLTITSR